MWWCYKMWMDCSFCATVQFIFPLIHTLCSLVQKITPQIVIFPVCGIGWCAVLYTGEDGEACTEAVAAEYSDNHLTTHGRRWENTRHSQSLMRTLSFLSVCCIPSGRERDLTKFCICLLVACCIVLCWHTDTQIHTCDGMCILQSRCNTQTRSSCFSGCPKSTCASSSIWYACMCVSWLSSDLIIQFYCDAHLSHSGNFSVSTCSVADDCLFATHCLVVFLLLSLCMNAAPQ